MHKYRYGCITKYRIEKTDPYLKYFLNHKNYFFVCQISLNIWKSLLFYKRIIWVRVKLTLSDNSDDLKIIFSLVYFNLNLTNLKNLRLLLNRCQSLCQKGFACVLIRLSYQHVAFENGSLVLILQSHSQIFIVKHID